jgi:hypothetical protein
VAMGSVEFGTRHLRHALYIGMGEAVTGPSKRLGSPRTPESLLYNTPSVDVLGCDSGLDCGELVDCHRFCNSEAEERCLNP